MANVQLSADYCRLYQAIQNVNLDKGGHLGHFNSQLAQENTWSGTYAAAVIVEYRRFLLLSCLDEQPIRASDAVNQAWFLHMRFSHSYWDDLCGKVLRRPLYHEPLTAADKNQQLRTQYQRALERYKEVFEVDPPEDIWPNIGEFLELEQTATFQRVDTRFYVWKPANNLKASNITIGILIWSALSFYGQFSLLGWLLLGAAILSWVAAQPAPNLIMGDASRYRNSDSSRLGPGAGGGGGGGGGCGGGGCGGGGCGG